MKISQIDHKTVKFITYIHSNMVKPNKTVTWHPLKNFPYVYGMYMVRMYTTIQLCIWLAIDTYACG